jgi:HAD superfamily hydrolase (TIGR01450 family)
VAQLSKKPTSKTTNAPVPSTILKSTPAEALAVFTDPSITHVLLDCDGVVYCNKFPLYKTKEMITHLQSIGKKVFFVTNSSSKSRQAMAHKVQTLMNLPDITADQMVPSCYAAATYVKSVLPPNKKCYVIGGKGVADELNLLGIECVGGPYSEGDAVGMSEEDIEGLVLDKDVGCVVVGMASDFTYKMLQEACLYLQQDPGCLLVSTNQDEYERASGRAGGRAREASARRWLCFVHAAGLPDNPDATRFRRSGARTSSTLRKLATRGRSQEPALVARASPTS